MPRSCSRTRAKYPAIADPTADFVYCRLQEDAGEDPTTGYSAAAIKEWAAAAKAWEAGGLPKGMNALAQAGSEEEARRLRLFHRRREVRNPAAATAFLKAL